jgi:hypothetical protein
MILIGNIDALPCFENIKKVYKPHIIFEETAAKLKTRSKLGLLRYMGIFIATTVRTVTYRKGIVPYLMFHN